MTPVWKICFRSDSDRPDIAQGYAQAETKTEALALVGHPDALAYRDHDVWSGSPDTRVFFTSGNRDVVDTS